MDISDSIPIGSDHPALANRYRLAAAVKGAETNLDASVSTFDAAFGETPGLLPLLDLKGMSAGLARICAASPSNLLAKLCLAESLHLDGDEVAAREHFIGVIRGLRPEDKLTSTDTELSETEFRQRISGADVWHSIDFGHAFIEGRRKNARALAKEMMMMGLPSLAGKTVLDVGAWGGWFTFEAERRGAARVTALDYYSWTMDTAKLNSWISEQRRSNLPYNPYSPPASCYDEVRLPGRATFEATRALLGSACDMRLGLLETLPITSLGVHDVVFYLGVLYHVENPFETLRKLAAVTGEFAVIETLGFCVPGLVDFPSFRFFGRGEVNQDPTTHWAPSEAGLREMLLAAGFSKVMINYGWNTVFPFRTNAPQLCRIWAHAWK